MTAHPLPDAPLEHDDAAYPTLTAAERRGSRLTQTPILPVFDGVALPSTWSRLGDALTTALQELWRAHRVPPRHAPARWACLQLGRVYVNAHAFERLRATVADREPHPELVAAPRGAIERVRAWSDRRASRGARRIYRERLRRAERRGASVLSRAVAIDLERVDTPELARGPFDRAVWAELLMPWLGGRIAELADQGPAAPQLRARVAQAIGFEQRCAAELGYRLAEARVLASPGDIAYLTLEERVAALRGAISVADRIARRRQRVAGFAEFDLPEDLAGPPSVDGWLRRA